ncbi:MAG: hypothetical protein ABSD78_14340 [Acidimicrobiales bacterium]|jgi:hypothetical protein
MAVLVHRVVEGVADRRTVERHNPDMTAVLDDDHAVWRMGTSAGGQITLPG